MKIEMSNDEAELIGLAILTYKGLLQDKAVTLAKVFDRIQETLANEPEYQEEKENGGGFIKHD